jgi:tetratricopeptide (TPR) repeat protein
MHGPRLLATLTLVVATAAVQAAQDSHSSHAVPVVPEEILTRPVTLRAGIGHAHESVETTSTRAQAFYDQGIEYLHSYVWIEAARSFHQALRLDSRLALAEVGLSYAYVELNAARKARDALSRAEALASGVSDRDRRRVEARARQMSAEDAPGDPRKLAGYRVTLDAALQKYPDDVELLLLRGMAESSDPAERGQGSPAAAVPFYQKALALAPNDDAPHHYLAHAYENTGKSVDALEHAAAYARMAPAIPHAHHMLGHELQRLGRMDEAIGAFEAADRLDSDYLRTEKIPAEYEWHYEHNLDLLGASYQYLGQMAKAERALKAAFGLPTSLVEQGFNKREWPGFLLSRGRIDEALAASRTLVDSSSPIVRATGHIAAGHALLASRRFKDAADEANAALHELNAAPDGAALASTALETLQGEFFLRTGEKDKARTMLEEAARRIRAAPGPDAWVEGLFALEAMARAAREAGDWDVAAWAASEMLAHDSSYPGTHFAAALAAEHEGDSRRAATEFAEAARGWAKADPGLPELELSSSRK